MLQLKCFSRILVLLGVLYRRRDWLLLFLGDRRFGVCRPHSRIAGHLPRACAGVWLQLRVHSGPYGVGVAGQVRAGTDIRHEIIFQQLTRSSHQLATASW